MSLKNSILYTPLPFLSKVNSVTWLHKVCFAIFSFIYALILVSITYDEIPDRHNYLNYASNSLLILLSNLNEGVLSLLLNEPIWLLINVILGLIFESEHIVKVFIFVPAFVVSYLTLKADPKNAIWLILFLTLPQVVKNHFTQIRQGVALSLFMIGYFSKKVYLQWMIFALVPFIHSSFFFVIIIYILTLWVKRINFSWDLRIFSYLLFGISISFLTLTVGSLMPVRQLQGVDEFNIVRMFGLGFAYWTFTAGLMFLNGSSFVKRYSFGIAAVLIYLSSYMVFPWAGRIFEGMLLFVILAGLNMSNTKKLIFVFSLLLYGVFNWFIVFTVGSTMFGT